MNIRDIEHIKFELFLREHENSTWTTKNGKEIKIKEMTTDHLKKIFLNSLKKEWKIMKIILII